MDLSLSEEQAQLAATVRSVLDRRADSRAVRAAVESDDGWDTGLWRLLCEQVGVAALVVPEEHDGVGASFVEAAVVLEELGRSLAPVPLLSSVVTAEALLAGAADDARTRLLPRLAAGEVGAFAVLRDGAASAVPDADHADVLVVADGDGLFEVDLAAPGASVERAWSPSVDQTLRLGSLRVDTSSPGARRIGDAAPAVARAELLRGRRRPRRRLRGARAADDGGLQHPARAVRAPHRVLPGAQAPDGRHAGPRRDVPVGVVGGGVRRGLRRPRRRAAGPRRGGVRR